MHRQTEEAVERAMKMKLKISIQRAQYIAQCSLEIWAPTALPTWNTITKMPTISVTFKNIALQFLVGLFKCGQG